MLGPIKKNKGGDNYEFENDILVNLTNGKTVGAYTTGQLIPSKGMTPEEFAKDIATEYIPPSFTSFNVTPQPSIVEVGTTISGSRTFTWNITPNDGVITDIDILDITAGTVLLAGAPNNGSALQAITSKTFTANGETQTWRAKANVAGKAHLNSAAKTITARFNRYWGPVANLPANVSDGAANRNYSEALTTGVHNNGTNTFTLATGTTHNTMVVILPPGKTITSVIDTTNLNLDLTANYILSTIKVNDAGGNPHNYNMYTFTNAGAYSTSANHVITTN